MIELSVIRDLVAIFGVIAGFAYYIVTIQNANKVSKIKLFMEIYDEVESRENQQTALEIYNWDWSDLDDWLNKYGYETNPEANARLDAFQNIWSKVGFLVKKGLIDVEDVYDMVRSAVVLFWERFEPINIGRRELFSMPIWMANFEYLYNEMKKIDAERFPELKT